MRILFVTPYPPSQIRIRAYGFLTQLQRTHEVTVLVQVSSRQDVVDAEALQQQGYTVEIVREPVAWSMLRSGRAFLSSVPLQVAYARSTRFLHAARRLCARHHFDVVHVEHLRGIASMWPLARECPLLWDAVDCISLLSEATAKAGPSFPVRAIAALEYRRTRRYEHKMLQRLPSIVTISERDRQAMLDLWGARNTYPEDDTNRAVQIDVVSSGVDLEYYSPVQQERLPSNIVFLGKMSYHANVAAVLYLYQQIMPLIWQQRPEATLTLVGSRPPKSLLSLARDPRVKVTGYVDDIRPYVRRAQVMVSPMVYSVGLQNKVLQAMALGTPVVTSAVSIAALNARPGRDLLVASSAEEFAEGALGLMRDPHLHVALSRYGRAYVEQFHDWHVMTNHLVMAYQKAIASYTSNDSSTAEQQSAVAFP